jgi:hypothetical protein
VGGVRLVIDDIAWAAWAACGLVVIRIGMYAVFDEFMFA